MRTVWAPYNGSLPVGPGGTGWDRAEPPSSRSNGHCTRLFKFQGPAYKVLLSAHFSALPLTILPDVLLGRCLVGAWDRD
jgi:hypothetical protein